MKLSNKTDLKWFSTPLWSIFSFKLTLESLLDFAENINIRSFVPATLKSIFSMDFSIKCIKWPAFQHQLPLEWGRENKWKYTIKLWIFSYCINSVDLKIGKPSQKTCWCKWFIDNYCSKSTWRVSKPTFWWLSNWKLKNDFDVFKIQSNRKYIYTEAIFKTKSNHDSTKFEIQKKKTKSQSDIVLLSRTLRLLWLSAKTVKL